MAMGAGGVVVWVAAVVACVVVAQAPSPECANVVIERREELVPPTRLRKAFMGQYVRITRSNLFAGSYGYDRFSGSVEVFRKDFSSGTPSWVYLQTLRAEDPHPSAYFGLNLSAVENHVLVGSPFHRRQEKKGGAAYVFDKGANGRFRQAQTLQPVDPVQNALYGYSVYMPDGLTALVGARRADDFVRENARAGAVYVYRRTAVGEKFKRWQKISFDGGQASDELRQVGDMFAIGAPRVKKGRGIVYMYKKKPNGTFNFQQELLPPVPEDIFAPKSNTHYGEGLAFNQDASMFAMGAENGYSYFGQTGIVDLFQRQANGTYTWMQHMYPPSGPDDMQYGQRIAFAGNLVVIGAWRGSAVTPQGTVAKAGRVYLWTRCYDGRFRLNRVVSLGGGARFDDNFGKSVDILWNQFAVGALRRDEIPNATPDAEGKIKEDEGAVYVYTFSYDCPRENCPSTALRP